MLFSDYINTNSNSSGFSYPLDTGKNGTLQDVQGKSENYTNHIFVASLYVIIVRVRWLGLASFVTAIHYDFKLTISNMLNEEKSTISFTLKSIMSQNGQIHFKNLAVSCNFSDHFSKLCIKAWHPKQSRKCLQIKKFIDLPLRCKNGW